jgi:hypothetical protein
MIQKLVAAGLGNLCPAGESQNDRLARVMSSLSISLLDCFDPRELSGEYLTQTTHS